MSLAAVMPRPQALEAPSRPPQADELQWIADVINALARNPALAQQLGEVAGDELITRLRAFMVGREQAALLAFGKGRQLFSGVEAAVTGLLEVFDAEDLLEVIPAILKAIGEWAEALSVEAVKHFVGGLWD